MFKCNWHFSTTDRPAQIQQRNTVKCNLNHKSPSKWITIFNLQQNFHTSNRHFDFVYNSFLLPCTLQAADGNVWLHHQLTNWVLKVLGRENVTRKITDEHLLHSPCELTVISWRLEIFVWNCYITFPYGLKYLILYIGSA